MKLTIRDTILNFSQHFVVFVFHTSHFLARTDDACFLLSRVRTTNDSFPAAFAASGYLPGTIFLLSFGSLSVVSQMMLSRLARRFGESLLRCGERRRQRPNVFLLQA